MRSKTNPLALSFLSHALNIPGGFLDENGQLQAVAENGLFPFNDGMKTLSADGDWVCKIPLGAFQGEQFSAGYIVFPNFCGVGYFADYGSIVVVEPVSLTQSRLVCEWIVHEDAVEGVDYEIDTLIAAWDRTNMEDIALAEGNYRGTTSMRYTPGPNNIRREGMILASGTAGPVPPDPAASIRSILRALSAHRITVTCRISVTSGVSRRTK